MGLQLKKFFHLHQIYQENKENYIVLLPIKEIQIPYCLKKFVVTLFFVLT